MLFLRFEAPSEHLHTLVAQLFSSSSALPSSQPLPARPLRHHASHHSRRRHPSPLEGSPVRRAAVLQLRRPPARALRADPRCTAALAGPVWRRDRCIRGGGAFGYKSSHSCTVCFLMWEGFFFRIRCYYSVWVVWVTSWPATRLPTSARGWGAIRGIRFLPDWFPIPPREFSIAALANLLPQIISSKAMYCEGVAIFLFAV